MNWSNLIQIFLLFLFFSSVLWLRYEGYYTPVYYYVEQCGDVVQVGQTNKMKWDQQLDYLEENPRGALYYDEIEGRTSFNKTSQTFG